MNILITGGTGSLGQALVHRLLEGGHQRVVVYSRDEWKQAQLAAQYPTAKALRCFLGDVRDQARLDQALYGIDTVIHAAALKRVDAIAYDPGEAIRTNALGSLHVIDAAIAAGVSRVVCISSDKAVAPTNFYGQTKALMEGYAVAANALGQPRGTAISVVRYGNVLGSRGSVVHLWRALVAAGQPLGITDARMTRFWITMSQAVELVCTALLRMQGGEIFVPKLSAARMIDVAEAMFPGYPTVVTGLRAGGEKLAESLLTPEEVTRTRVVKNLYLVIPALQGWGQVAWEGKPLDPAFRYTSETVYRLSVGEIQTMLEGV